MLVYRRITPSSMLPVPILYAWVERDNVGQSILSKKTTRWQLDLDRRIVKFRIQRNVTEHRGSMPFEQMSA